MLSLRISSSSSFIICGRWPEPISDLIIDSTPFHHSANIEQLYIIAGVKFLSVLPYSPDLNPIKEFFAELKSFIKRNWQHHSNTPQRNFGTILNVAC